LYYPDATQVNYRKIYLFWAKLIAVNEIMYVLGRDFLQSNNVSIDWAANSLGVGPRIRCSAGVGIQDPHIQALIKEYQDVFVERLDSNAGAANVPAMDIQIDPSVKPTYQRNYRMSPKENERVVEEIQKLLNSGAISKAEASSTVKGWNSPILVVPKITEKFVSASTFISWTPQLSAPLPLITKILERAHCTVFTSLDLASGYHQIPMTKQARSLLTFEFRGQQYQFNSLPFGVTNAPVWFQRFMTQVMDGIPDVSAFIDDLNTASKNMEEHLVALHKVFERLRQFNLKVNPRKCTFAQGHLDAFGFTVFKGTIKPHADWVEAINRLKVPTNAQELQSFLGMMNYFRQFIVKFAEDEAVL